MDKVSKREYIVTQLVAGLLASEQFDCNYKAYEKKMVERAAMIADMIIETVD